MKIQKYLLPLFVSSHLVGQTSSKHFTAISFGFSHSTFTSLSMQPGVRFPKFNPEQRLPNLPVKITETHYGFGIGLFLCIPLNENITFKPKIEGIFSNTCRRQPLSVYATSFDLNFSHGFIILLKKPDPNGIIYMARNMTCYLTSKQPYIVIGPKINLKKYDRGYLRKGFENELAIGFFVGYGINYVFQGKNVSPEICYTLNTTSQNKINDSRKMTHTITLSINFI